MTTIILTIIGILLAAAAALMVIFYGGDAFNQGTIGAQANTLQNAGTNIESANTLRFAEQASNAATVAELVSGNYLKEAPALTGIGTLDEDLSNGWVQVTDVSGEVCAKVNENLDVAPTAVGEGKMGCFDADGDVDTADGTFFASL